MTREEELKRCIINEDARQKLIGEQIYKLQLEYQELEWAREKIRKNKLAQKNLSDSFIASTKYLESLKIQLSSISNN